MDKEHENQTQGVETPAQDSTKPENTGEEKTFSQDKVDEIVQRRLREQKEKFEKKTQEQIDRAIEEYKRKSQLSDDELRNEEIESKKKQLEEQTKAFEREKTTFQMRNALSEAGLNPELADLVNSNDAEKNKQIVESIKLNFEEMVKVRLEKELNEVTKGSTPQDTSANNGNPQPKTGIVAF